MAHYYEQKLDFNGARADLDSVLQDIVNKANANDEAAELDCCIDTDLENHEKIKNVPFSSEFDSPRKFARKRKRKDDLKEDRHRTNSCVMKLFDRSVDLAQFSEDTPLFPLCRTWMQNDPYKEKYAQTFNSADKSIDSASGFVVIPPPDKVFQNFTADGRYVSPRIPSPPAQPHDDLESYLKGNRTVPRAENLLLDNLHHWKTVREKWQAKSMENEFRYCTGMSVLKDLSANQAFTN